MARISIRGSTRGVRVGKIVCVGRNYAEHVREMRAESRGEPLLFLKPSTALLSPGEPIRLPRFTSRVEHEVELVAWIGRRLRRAGPTEALDAVAGYAVGIDLTARDLQATAKERGEPWAIAKGFDGSAPLSELLPGDEIGDPADLPLELEVNGELRQAGRTSEMLFPLPELLGYASRYFTLEPGDLLFTGTPSGVGPLRPGDRLEARAGAARAGWRVEAAPPDVPDER